MITLSLGGSSQHNCPTGSLLFPDWLTLKYGSLPQRDKSNADFLSSTPRDCNFPVSNCAISRATQGLHDDESIQIRGTRATQWRSINLGNKELHSEHVIDRIGNQRGTRRSIHCLPVDRKYYMTCFNRQQLQLQRGNPVQPQKRRQP
jgi:hypothetical protein